VKRRPRPPTLLKLGLLLLAGAIINVAVAWALSARPYETGQSYNWLPSEDDIAWWKQNAPLGFGPSPAGVTGSFRFGRYSLFMHEQLWSEANRTLGSNCLREMDGWPFVSLEWEAWVDRKARVVHERHALVLPQQWPFPTSRSVRLPTQPIVLGTILNTLIYALVTALLFQFLTSLRRLIRIKRGLCPACAYPVGTNEKCTECGNRVTPRSVEPIT
jgi:hypothetical protein